MILLLAGASHTGKTALSQQLLEKLHIPYLSIDHLKMGLIRSGHTELTPQDDDQLTGLLWPIIREMIKTAIENGQNLIVEGCYIPFDWEKDFAPEYRKHIRYRCLILSEDYIRENFDRIKAHANDIERRLDDSGCTAQWLMEENIRNLELCRQYGCGYCLISKRYDIRALTEMLSACFVPERKGE